MEKREGREPTPALWHPDSRKKPRPLQDTSSASQRLQDMLHMQITCLGVGSFLELQNKPLSTGTSQNARDLQIFLRKKIRGQTNTEECKKNVTELVLQMAADLGIVRGEAFHSIVKKRPTPMS